MSVIVNCNGATRFPLASDEGTKACERILQLLRGYLGDQLIVDDETISNGILDLTGGGSLRRWVDLELDRSEQNAEQIRALTTHRMPYHRALGDLCFAAMDGTKSVYLSFDEYSLSPVLDELRFGNTLTIESEETVLSGAPLAESALALMGRLFDNDLFDHGYCCLSDQYDAKNLDRSEGGVRAVGLDASKCLPGFYWGNYFGSYLCDLIRTDVLMTVPGCNSVQLSSGVLVANVLPPDRWSDTVLVENERSAISHIGRHLFFEKGKASNCREIEGHATLFRKLGD